MEDPLIITRMVMTYQLVSKWWAIHTGGWAHIDTGSPPHMLTKEQCSPRMEGPTMMEGSWLPNCGLTDSTEVSEVAIKVGVVELHPIILPVMEGIYL